MHQHTISSYFLYGSEICYCFDAISLSTFFDLRSKLLLWPSSTARRCDAPRTQNMHKDNIFTKIEVEKSAFVVVLG